MDGIVEIRQAKHQLSDIMKCVLQGGEGWGDLNHSCALCERTGDTIHLFTDQHTLLSRVSSRKLVPPPDLKSGLVRRAREGNPQPELGPEKRSRKTLPRLELPGKRSANVFDTKIEPVLSAITASADFAGMTLTELGLSTAPKI